MDLLNVKVKQRSKVTQIRTMTDLWNVKMERNCSNSSDDGFVDCENGTHL